MDCATEVKWTKTCKDFVRHSDFTKAGTNEMNITFLSLGRNVFYGV